jgi:hypothetical protein
MPSLPLQPSPAYIPAIQRATRADRIRPERGPDLRDPSRLRTALAYALVESYSQQEPDSGQGDVTNSTPLAVDDNGSQQAVFRLLLEPETPLKKQFLLFQEKLLIQITRHC